MRDSDEKRAVSLTAFIDRHWRAFKLICVYGVGAAGVVMVAKSLRLMTTFNSATCIPQVFVDKGFTLYGEVRKFSVEHSSRFVFTKDLPEDASVGPWVMPLAKLADEDTAVPFSPRGQKTGEATKIGDLILYVKHEPIIRAPRLFQALKRFSPGWIAVRDDPNSDGLIHVRLACVAVLNEDFVHEYLETKILKQTVSFKLIDRTQDIVDCVVLLQKSRLTWGNLNQKLVRRRMAYVLPFNEKLKDKVDYNLLYARLLSTEEAADKKHIRMTRLARFRRFLDRIRRLF